MPTYDYQCSNGHSFELFQKMSDEPVTTCPECGAEARRQISGGAGFLFKGDGFYITDYRSDEYKKKASADKGESKGESSSSGSSSSSSSGDSSSSSSSGSSSSSSE
jgi:putative FmdB family regulatory protein